MKDIIKKYLFIAIAFISGILVTLGSTIFQNYSFTEQISIFKIVLIVLLALLIITVLYFSYSQFNMIKWKIFKKYKDLIGIEGRIKREIKQIKQGKNGKYISLKDMEEILQNKNKFEHIKDFDLFWNHLSNIQSDMRVRPY